MLKKIFKAKIIVPVICLIVLLFAGYYYYNNQKTQSNIFNESESLSSIVNTYEEAKLAIEEANVSDNAKTYDKPFNLESGFADLVDFVSPAVVNISVVKIVKHNGMDIPLENMDPAFRELLKNLLPQQQPQKQMFVSLGSGFVVRSDGYIVTNHHVVQEADTIQVTFDNGKKYIATIHASDELTDVAVLKIDATNLPTLKFANSNEVRTGEWVIAIGNPYGLGGTVSAGIVSAKSRDINLVSYSDYIQTDTSINRGNSGGPLINTRGEVLGINTAIFSTTGANIGIGFALTSNISSKIVAHLIQNKYVVRSWLGVQIQEIDQSIATALKLENTNGALVASVVDNSPASEAGLKSGDIIIAINGNTIANSRILPKTISDIAPNTKITLTIISEDVKKDIQVELKALPAQQNSMPNFSNSGNGDNVDTKLKEKTYEELGIKVAEINTAVRKYFGLPDNAEGVIILMVGQDSVAIQKGFAPGVKILEVNKTKIKSISDLDKVIKDNNKVFL